MLKYFGVEGFKNFSKGIKLDFADVRDYQFSRGCIKDNLLSKIIVYGKNAVGKSNLGLALFDITTHLTDYNVSPGLYDYYLSAENTNTMSFATFWYTFQFGTTEVVYMYRKSDMNQLISESITIDGENIFNYNYQMEWRKIDDKLKRYAPTLNFEFADSSNSILKYVVNNSNAPELEPLKQVVRFVSGMLWFRSLDENRYIGQRSNSKDYYSFIFEKNNLSEFQDFLSKSSVDEKVKAMKDPSGDMVLYFDKEKPLPFFKVASNGTKALYTLFYWIKTSKELSFLFIDEFDAYYHVELSESIVEMLEGYPEFQTILTSHNTNLLSNRIMRPDCYFILTKDSLVSFANATSRELREGHNLEKLYISGEFDG